MVHISVSIPVFNRAHLVGRTIESILNQTFTDFDIIVVDDASQDNTVEIARSYAQQDQRIRIITNTHNLGLTRNWNKCLDLAKGPLVQIVQSDDLVDPDYFQIVSNVFDRYPNLGFVAATCRYIDPDDNVIISNPPTESRLYQAGDEAVTALLKGGWPHVSSIVMRRECYEKLGKFNVIIWHGPDGEIFTRFATQYDYYYFGEAHTSFRRHGSNMGVLEYLRNDFLEVDMYKKRLTWSYLSPEGRQRLGIEDLDNFLIQDAVCTALLGATITIAYGKPKLSRFYLRQALNLDRQIWKRSRFWKILVLLLLPNFGKRIMETRMRISEIDKKSAKAVESSLLSMTTSER